MQTETRTKQPSLVLEDQPAAKLPAVRKARQTTVVAPSQQTTPMDLLRIVTERGASADEIGKFMDLMERQQAAEAKGAFVRAMAAFKKNPPDIYKNKAVGYEGKDGNLVGYMHATLGNICEQIIAALAEHGISHDWSVEQLESGLIRVTCTLTHELGHSKGTSMEAPADNSGKKNPIQSIASAVTYLERYTLLAACGIAVKEQGDDDGQAAGASAQPTSEPPAKKPSKQPIGDSELAQALRAIKANKYTRADLMGFYSLTAAQLQRVEQELGKGEATQ
jgi:hypothetical protein